MSRMNRNGLFVFTRLALLPVLFSMLAAIAECQPPNTENLPKKGYLIDVPVPLTAG